MKLPGNNQIELCGMALCQIVQEHLNAQSYSKESPVRVSSARSKTDSGTTVFVFSVTTDELKATGAQA